MAYRKIVTTIKRESLIEKLVKVLIEWNKEEITEGGYNNV